MEKISITGILRTPSGHPYKTRIRVNCISSSIAVPNTFMEYTSDHMGSYSFYLVPGTYNIQVEFNRRFIDFGLLTVKPEDIKEVFNLQEIIERTKEESELEEDLEKVIAFKKYILNTLYPVGSIYTSFEDKNPGEFLGGTWELIQSGYVKIGGNSDHGGSNSVVLNSSNIPSHTHDFNITGHTNEAVLEGSWWDLVFARNYPPSGIISETGEIIETGIDNSGGDLYKELKVNATHTHEIEISGTLGESSGGSTPVNIEPEYTRVFMFKRIDAPEDTEDLDLTSSINSLLKKSTDSISASSTALVTSKAVALELEKYLKLGQIAEITDEDIDWILS